MFRTLLLFLSLTALLTSCSQREKDAREAPTSQLQTGDHFLVNDLGDTMPTGVPIPARGKRIDPDSVAHPRAIRLFDDTIVVPIPSNVRPAGTPRIVPFSKELKTFTPGRNGTPLPKKVTARPRILPAMQSAPMPASPPVFKDEAKVSIQHLNLGPKRGVNAHILYALEDSRGYLWLGSSNNIYRYDGFSFVHYTIADLNLDNNDTYIWSMLEDSRGVLWFGTTTDQLCRYDGDTFSLFYGEENLLGRAVLSLLEDAQGNLWFGTDHGVIRFDGAFFTRFTTAEGLAGNIIGSMLKDSKGNIWFGTDHGPTCYQAADGGRFVHLTDEEGLMDRIIFSMAEDSRGNLWFGTEAGAIRYDGAGFAHFTEKEGLSNAKISHILEDSRGNLWFGTDGDAIRYDGARFAHFTEKEGLSSARINSIFEDSHGNLWFSATQDGIYRYVDTGFSYYTKKDGLINNPVRSMLEDRQGNLWFGTLHGGITGYRPSENGEERFIQYPRSRERQTLDHTIRSMLVDSRENLWLGCPDGVIRRDQALDAFQLNDANYQLYTPKEGLSGADVRTMIEDRRGNLWFGTRNQGVSCYQPGARGGNFIHFTTAEGLIDNRVRSLLEDSRGNIWIGTINGVSRLAGAGLPEGPATFTHYTTREGLSDNNVREIFEDSGGNLWFGTQTKGVTRYNPNNEEAPFLHYTVKEGLSDNAIKSILEDKEKNIWISTQNGITLLLFSDNERDPAQHATTDHDQVYTFDRSNGLMQTDFFYRGVMLDRQNRIWWGSQKGLTVLDLNQFHLKRTAPKIRLNHVEIAQNYIDFRRLADTAYRHSIAFGDDLVGAFDSVAAFLNYPLGFSLPYHLNHLTFHFTAPDWSAPGAVRFSYRIEGLDDHWSPPTSENKADYRNLPPGKYTLQVKAIGAARIWSEVFEYPFAIRPPWWRTWLAYAVYGGLILLVLYGLRQYELRRYLAVSEAKRLQELDAFKTRLYTNITHEFRTPLTIILGMVRQIREDPKKWYSEGMEMIYRNGRQLLYLVNQMLDLSKLDEGKLQLRMQRGEIVGFLHYLMQSFESFAAGKNIQLHFLKEIDQLEMDFDPDQLTKVVSNLLSNAVKFTPERGQVYVLVESRESRVEGQMQAVDRGQLASEKAVGDLRGANEYLQIKIKDTGPGIAAEELPHIFDRFYQADSSATRKEEGAGVGLALTKELVQLMGGKIQVQSKPGEGSDFSVWLPVSRMAPKADTPRSSVEIAGVDATIPMGAAGVSTDQPGPDTAMKRPSGSPGKDRPTVLLIEDNRDVLTYLASCLEGDYQLEFAMNGREGIEQALEIVPDIIISDVMMPEKDGFEVCATLKEDIRTSHIPIILLTAKADRDARLEGLRAGADAYLAKPFDKEELDILMENMLALRRQLQARYGALQAAPIGEEKVMSREDLFLQELRETLEANLSDESFGIAQLCRKAGMSRSQLHNKLKALTGLSTSHYIRSIRLEKAKELLRNTDMTISEVAYEVGFRTPLYFTQVFTEEVGAPPSSFRTKESK